MTNSTKLLLSLLFLAFATTRIQAQLNVISAGGSSFTPEELITNVFLGEGVKVTSISFQGKANQVGYFNGASADIGLDRGIVMTTGLASVVAGPQTDSPSNIAGTSISDADLKKIGQDIQPGSDVNDVAIYEITFIPIADTLRFRYVFSSEEYPEYVCTQFNDVFGFFISGPGISGVFSNNSKNIALVPDPSDPTGFTFTTDPVSITNVQNGNPGNSGCAPSYPMYYHDNAGSMNLAYDAYTSVFTAQAIVQPCQEYHIKLAIADLGDDILDTGVFLEAKSFGTGSVITDLQTVSVDGTIVEGCSGATIKFTTPNALSTDLSLNYNILGTATHPADYTVSQGGTGFTPGDPLVIVAGDTMVTLDIMALEDGIVENGEFIGISVQKDVCTVDTLLIPIRDNILVNPNLGLDTSICNGGMGSILHLNGDLGLPEPPAPTFTYTGDDEISNDLPPVYAPIQVNGVQPPFLADGVIRSVCVKVDHKFDADLDMFLFSPNNTPVLLSSDNGNNSRNVDVCFTPSGPPLSTLLDDLKAQFPPNGVVDFANINNLYFTGNYSPEGDLSDFWSGGANSPANGQWRLMIIDDQGSQFGDGATGKLKEWSITFEPLFRLNYQWDNTTDLSCLDCPDPDLTLPSQTTTYTLTVSDTYGCSVTDEITVFVQDSLEAPIIDCQLIGMDYITFGWSPVPGANSYEVNIDGAGWQSVGTDTSSTVNGLSLNQTVLIQVRAVGSCPAKIGIHDCTSLEECLEPNLAVQVTPTLCNGNTDGAISINISSGDTPPYTFTLGTETNTTGLFNGLAAGNAHIIVTDSVGCTYPFDILVTEPDLLVANGIETQKVDCYGGNTGAGQITVSGGVSPYFYSLSSGSSPNLAQATAGTYPFIVTDSKGCKAVGDIVITENPEITFQTQIVDPTCFSASDGQITIFNLQGGVPGFNFNWDDSQNQTTQGATLLNAGNYAVTVSDNLGCTATASNLILTAPTEITATVQKTNAVCGGAPGSAIISPTGGAGNYTYNWNDIGAGTDTRNDLAGGLYVVTITDQNNCTAVISIDIEAPSDMVLKMTESDVDCNSNNTGQASVSVSGGQPPYQYKWNDAMFQTDKTAINLPAGVFKVLVTDNQQCIQSDSVEVFEPTELLVDTLIQHVACFGGSDASITPTVTGGTPPYSYEYQLPNNTTETTPNLNNIAAGNYILTVTDDHNCQVILSITITEPSAVSLAFANSNTICYGANDGFTEVNVTGGTAPFSYLWSNGETTKNIVDLAANTYQVTVTDAAGCSYTEQTTIDAYGEIIATLNQTPSLCHDEANGAAIVQEINVNGATMPKSNYSFQWNTSPQQTTFDAYQLIGGNTYQVSITDNTTGCAITEDIEIGNPDALAGKIVQIKGITCKGRIDGSAEIIGSGGTPAYTYQWDASANNQVGNIANNLGKDRYIATITDANGCTATIEVEIDEPDAIALSFAVDHVNCSGEATGAIQSTVTGGEQPYNYLWTLGQTTANIENINAGTYELTVTDNRGCTEVQSTNVTEPGAPLAGSTATHDITCNGGRDGSILITPSGGTAPYQYSLDGATPSNISNKVGLYPGDYQVVIIDSRGCTAALPTQTLSEPAAVELDLGPNLILPYGDSVLMNPSISNAVGDVTYSWSTSSQESLSCFDCRAPWAFPSYQEYVYLTVTDENGCSAEAQVLFNVTKTTKILVPTGFSPNGDGQNDVLFVLGEEDVVIESFGVFDRWGEQVFFVEDVDINDFTKGWDGTYRGQPLPYGQYAWQLKAKMLDGRTEILQGFSTLLR